MQTQPNPEPLQLMHLKRNSLLKNPPQAPLGEAFIRSNIFKQLQRMGRDPSLGEVNAPVRTFWQ